jgi:hypothetical protein
MKHNPDFHLDATWEFPSPNDKSHGLFRVNADTIYIANVLPLKKLTCGFGLIYYFPLILFMRISCTVVKFRVKLY